MMHLKQSVSRKNILLVVLGLTLFLSVSQNIIRVGRRFSSVLSAPEASTPAHQALLDTLHNLADLPLDEKRRTLLYIPPDNTLYWEWFEHCSAVSFVAPGITGISLLDGLPPGDCSVRNYGYATYQARSPSPIRQNPDNLCQAAQANGFSTVIVLQADTADTVVTERVECSP